MASPGSPFHADAYRLILVERAQCAQGHKLSFYEDPEMNFPTHGMGY